MSSSSVYLTVWRPRSEIGLHSIREATYASLFGGLAWCEWHGAAALFIPALRMGEIIVTTCDEFVENRVRVLPQNERVLHIFLTLNLGFVIAVLVLTLSQWGRQDTGLTRIDYDLLSWVLTLFALMGVGFSMHDFIAWRTLGKVEKSYAFAHK